MTEQLKPLLTDAKISSIAANAGSQWEAKAIAERLKKIRDEYEAERRALWDSNKKLMAELLEAKRMIRRLQLGVTEHMTTDAHYAAHRDQEAV